MDDDAKAQTPSDQVAARGRLQEAKERGQVMADGALTWLERRRKEFQPLDVAVALYERDREALASVLGAAVAMRLYLYLIPAVATVVGVLIALFGHDKLDSILSSSSMGATVAQDISNATSDSRAAGFALFFVGLWLMAWAGRSLTKGLAACAGRSWRLEAKVSRATITAAGCITAVAMLMLIVTLVLNRIRALHGVAAGGTSWVLSAAVFTACWFVISSFLPRGTQDPGALLPGAGFVGVSLAVLQWFMQFYLPHEIARSSAFAGELGFSIAVLGYLFLVGRVMAVSFVIDAVLFEEVGSLSQFLFELPVVRAIPRRYPGVARFFDLPDQDSPTTDEPG